ncbi:3,4-dihydroxy-2-butanone-4-phosphate synthase [Shigella flexneri]
MVLYDEYRENEGDMIFPAETITVEQMAPPFATGAVLFALRITDYCRKATHSPIMVQNNTSAYGTGFTVTIEHSEGVTTGVSAADRITTVRAAIADGAKPSDLTLVGRRFPLRAQAGGVLNVAGHTEATIDSTTPAGFSCWCAV